MNPNILQRPGFARRMLHAGTAGLLALGLASCGPTTNAKNAKISACGEHVDHSPFGAANGATPIETSSGFLAAIQENLKVLH